MKEATVEPQPGPIRVLQLGEGRFLRSFATPLFMQLARQNANPFRVLMTNMRPGGSPTIQGIRDQGNRYDVIWATQEGLVTSRIQGFVPTDVYGQWNDIVDVVTRPELSLIVSNGTEKGLNPPTEKSWPKPPGDGLISRLALILRERWHACPDAPLCLMPTELIPHNGEVLCHRLLEAVNRWGSDADFLTWLENYPTYLNSLVDRIVVPIPATVSEALQARVSDFSTLAESYGRWWIQRPKSERQCSWIETLQGAVEVQIVEKVAPYEALKLFLLNGAHIGLAALGRLAGHVSVKEAFDDPRIRPTLEAYWKVSAPWVPLPQEVVATFIEDLRRRLSNPVLQHPLEAIMVNLRDKWRIRMMPIIQHQWDDARSIAPPLVQLSAAIYVWLVQTRKIDKSERLWGTDEPPWASILASEMSRFWVPAESGGLTWRWE